MKQNITGVTKLSKKKDNKKIRISKHGLGLEQLTLQLVLEECHSEIYTEYDFGIINSKGEYVQKGSCDVMALGDEEFLYKFIDVYEFKSNDSKGGYRKALHQLRNACLFIGEELRKEEVFEGFRMRAYYSFWNKFPVNINVEYEFDYDHTKKLFLPKNSKR